MTVLQLEADPRAVRDARAWVVDALTHIGRQDLVEAARLGISELVTNAILHAEPPIQLRLAGSKRRPRVEVHDSSLEPPMLRDMTDEARLLATVGRGLSIVAMYSQTWGAEMSAHGKVVWFEPSRDADLVVDRLVPGQVFDFDALVDDLPRQRLENRVHVTLLGMPVRVFLHYRLWYDELRRELRLLGLGGDGDAPVARELSQLSVQVEHERRRATGTAQLDQAAASGVDRVDLDYDVPATTPATMARLHQVLVEADTFCRDQRLLTVASSPQLRQLRDWYLGEFVRQGRGEEPLPWPGGYTVEESDR
jgi:anti-sigma regulatory factor (Ser/Thr protein kinase)